MPAKKERPDRAALLHAQFAAGLHSATAIKMLRGRGGSGQRKFGSVSDLAANDSQEERESPELVESARGISIARC